MIERILRALDALRIETYAISETDTESAEAFYVRRRLDMKRRTVLTDYSVTVYRPFKRDGAACLGSSTAPVYPDMEEDELRAALEAAYRAAGLVPNPAYELYAGEREDFVPSRSGFAGRSPEENLRAMAEALFAADVHEDAFLNSAEFFATRTLRRVINSRGVDVSWERCEVQGEYVIQCVSPRDVETHHIFRYREPDAAALRGEAERAIERTRDRARAEEPPATGTYTVLLSGEQVATLLGYYRARSSASMIYQKYSDWTVGQTVQGDVRGDALSIVLKAAEPYDGEGIPLRDRPLLEDGALRTVHGGARFSGYLGIEPTGAYRCVEVPTGRTPLAEMKRQPCLHVVSFSDFQIDSFTGHFGGEIRLGYLFDGERERVVTGGSINGSLPELQGNMTFSRERYRSADYDGPFAVAIRGVAVAGRGEA